MKSLKLFSLTVFAALACTAQLNAGMFDRMTRLFASTQRVMRQYNPMRYYWTVRNNVDSGTARDILGCKNKNCQAIETREFNYLLTMDCEQCGLSEQYVQQVFSQKDNKLHADKSHSPTTLARFYSIKEANGKTLAARTELKDGCYASWVRVFPPPRKDLFYGKSITIAKEFKRKNDKCISTCKKTAANGEDPFAGNAKQKVKKRQ